MLFGKWPENAPEAISEGIKFKNFLGESMAPDPCYCAHFLYPSVFFYYFAPPGSFF